MKTNQHLRILLSLALVLAMLLTNAGLVTYAEVTTPVSSAASGSGNQSAVTVSEDIHVTDASYVEAASVTADSDAEASLNVQGNIAAEGAGTGGTALNAEATFGGTVTADIQGDLSAESSAGDACGMDVDATDGGSAVVNVEGNVAATAPNGDSTAVGAVAMIGDSSIDISVNGDVSADGEHSTGVHAGPDNGAAVNITVDGSVKADADIEAKGVSVALAGSPIPDPSEAEVHVTGDVTAQSVETAHGVSVGAIADKDLTVTVDGSVQVETEKKLAEGVEAYAADGSATITVGEDVTAKSSEGSALGISTTAEDQGFVQVEVAGALTVEADGTGIEVVTSGTSETTVNVGGPVTVTGTEYAAGLSMMIGEGKADVSLSAITVTAQQYQQASAININTTNGTSTVNVDGDVQSDGTGVNLFMAKDGAGEADLQVTGDVKAGTYGLTAITGEGSSVVSDILVNGTLHGDAHAIVVDEKTTDENLKLTVWKVDLDKDGDAVKSSQDVISVTENSKKFEQSILYIVRIEDPGAGATLSAVDQSGNALSTSHDLPVAREGDTVMLKVNLEPGYSVTGAYSDEGKSVQLLQDANGQYYVVVEKGGGVYLSVKLEKTGGGGGYDWKGAYTPVEKKEKDDVSEHAGETFDIIIDFDGGTDFASGAGGSAKKTVSYGTWLQLPAAQKPGAKLVRWQCSDPDVTAKYPGDYFCVKKPLSFTAIWSDGSGTAMGASDTVTETAAAPAAPVPAVTAEVSESVVSEAKADQENGEASIAQAVALNLSMFRGEGSTLLAGLGEGVSLPAKLIIDLGDGNNVELPVNLQLTLAGEPPVAS